MSKITQPIEQSNISTPIDNIPIKIHQEKIVCIEVKSNYSNNIKGIEAFKKSYSIHRSYLVGQNGMNLEEFLSLDPLELF